MEDDTNDAHDAVEDSEYLQKLTEHYSIDTTHFQLPISYVDVIKQMEIIKSLMPMV